jgi:hypothetical protein
MSTEKEQLGFVGKMGRLTVQSSAFTATIIRRWISALIRIVLENASLVHLPTHHCYLPLACSDLWTALIIMDFHILVVNRTCSDAKLPK